MTQKLKKPAFSNLHGKRLNLIKVNPDGLADMHEYSIIPEFYTYFEYGPFTSKKETKQYLTKLIKLTKSPKYHYWFIELKNRKVIGTFGVGDINVNRLSAEISYGISPLFWGKGYFHEALSLALKHLFSDLGFHRISSKIHSDNVNSIRSLKKIGFKKEGIMRDYLSFKNRKRADVDLFSILRHEFISKKK
jgi:ribosomal-protein-alanine N-acetyltransferase